MDAIPPEARFIGEDGPVASDPFLQTIADVASHMMCVSRDDVALSVIPGIARVAIRMSGISVT